MGRHVLMAFLFLIFIPIFHAMATEIKVVSPSFSSHDFDVSIEVNSSVGLGGMQCDFSFNASLLKVKSIENGGMFDIWWNNVTFPLIDNKNGSIKNMVAFSIGNTSYKGTFAIIHFEIVEEGVSYLNVENALLSDRNANPVDASIQNASIITDKTPPEIKNVEISVINGVNITCDVVEKNIQYVRINLTYPDGKKKEFDMAASNQKYFFNTSLKKGNYSFFIIARDMAGNEASSLPHQFSIKNHPPVKPYSPFPNDNAKNVSTAILSWKCYDLDNDSLKYDVYFGTSSNPPKVAENITGNFYNLPALQYSTTYYWKIVAWDGNDKNESKLWSFTTGSQKNYPPAIQITYPDNGSIVSESIEIKGTASDADGSVERVEIKIDNDAWQLASGTTSWSYGIDTTKLSDGNHVIYARAYDGKNYSKIASLSLIVKNQKKYKLTIKISPSNAGYVTPYGGTYDAGTIVKITAHANAGYAFDHWSGDASGGSSTIQIKMDGDKSVVAFFVPLQSPPVVDFYYEPSSPYAGEIIQFYDKSSDASEWHWDFGDGNSSSQKNPGHSYLKAGKYDVTLTVVINGKEYTKSKTINVRGKEKAFFTFHPLFPSPGTTIYFYGAGKNIVSWTWDFGDGSYGYEKNVTHAYGEGNYTVVLRIKDKWGNEDNISKELHVEYPDFSIENIQHEKENDMALIKAFLKNNGGDAQNVTIALYLNGDEILKEKINISHGIQGFEKNVEISEGKNEIKIVIDPENKFIEKNESNNVASFVIYGKRVFSFHGIYAVYVAIALIILTSLYLLKFRKKEITIASSKEEARCTVCFGKFKPNSEIVKCECGAMFHKSCATRVKVCPNCGRKLI